ncbi:hypothetical protein [Nonomuraea sp. NPDC048901]|uniref:hypothetical protein n=1 Tax=Nonomuraea sp. NPDC048901 TaxID=3155627 RepID=UPI0033CD1B76
MSISACGYVEQGLGQGTFDFARDLSAKLPLDVISEVMGVHHAWQRTGPDQPADYRPTGVNRLPSGHG